MRKCLITRLYGILWGHHTTMLFAIYIVKTTCTYDLLTVPSGSDPSGAIEGFVDFSACDNEFKFLPWLY